MLKKRLLVTAIALSTTVGTAGWAAEQIASPTGVNTSKLLLAQQTPPSSDTPLPAEPAGPEAPESGAIIMEPSDEAAGLKSEQTPTELVVTEQTEGQLQADKLIGMTVLNEQEENIGSITDLIVDRDGRVVAAVLSVGGFLGIGDKKVGVAWDQVNILPEQESVFVSMSKEQLETAPEFKTLSDAEAKRKAEQADQAESTPAPRPGAPLPEPEGESRTQ